MANAMTQFTLDQLRKSASRLQGSRKKQTGAQTTQTELDAMQRAFMAREKARRDKKKEFGASQVGRGINKDK